MKYYFVGGYVRDQLLGIKSKDIDFAVEAPSYESMREDIIARGSVIFQERPEFLSIRARDPKWGPLDYTVCRMDGFYSDARHPDIVHIGTIYDDLSRRDFTVNAIAKSEDDGIYIDPFNGRSDIELMMLRCVGNTEDRLREDPLRILRAVRFHIVRGFHISDELSAAIKNIDIIYYLKTVPIERVYEELKKCYEVDSYGTIKFFRDHSLLEFMVFGLIGLNLEPRIG